MVNEVHQELRPFWRRFFKLDWRFGLLLVLLVCIPRFWLVLRANASGNYGAIGLIMFLSALAPFIFLTRDGRRLIGMVRPHHGSFLLLSVVTGLAASLALFYLGKELYGDSYSHWYKYIAKSYKIPSPIGVSEKRVMFLIMAATGMSFSPIGEELFFRGMVHVSMARSFGDKVAMVVDGAAFALTHLAHFGIIYLDGGWTFLPFPALIWVSAMFGVSVVFNYFKKASGSILGAILCHAAFNLGMIYSIFYMF